MGNLGDVYAQLFEFQTRLHMWLGDERSIEVMQ